jgi:general L-amino acid transport system permease protein
VAVGTEIQRTSDKRALLSDERVRGVILQILVAAAVLAFAAFVIHNTVVNLQRLGISTGFRFWNQTAGFDIAQTLIPYEMTSTYGRAFWVGLVNTLVVSAVGIVLATLIGFIVGVARLSRNWLIAKLAAAYVDLLRNIPLLLQILFWYFGVLATLPAVRQSLSFGDAVFLSNRGLYAPALVAEPGFGWVVAAFVLGLAGAVGIARWAKRRQDRTGEQFPIFRVAVGLLLGPPLLVALVTGLPWSWEYPELRGFNFSGGVRMLPEFVALLLALTLYTAAFIAEIVRAGIQSVSRGQTEAAYALGLRPRLTTRLIIIPQALRVIVPPLTSQYLNLTKNSSLAVAIGYPDLVSVFTGTVLNQTGQAVEVIAITMLVYLTISLLISMFMNWYNRRIALVER